MARRDENVGDVDPRKKHMKSTQSTGSFEIPNLLMLRGCAVRWVIILKKKWKLLHFLVARFELKNGMEITFIVYVHCFWMFLVSRNLRGLNPCCYHIGSDETRPNHEAKKLTLRNNRGIHACVGILNVDPSTDNPTGPNHLFRSECVGLKHLQTYIFHAEWNSNVAVFWAAFRKVERNLGICRLWSWHIFSVGLFGWFWWVLYYFCTDLL